MRYLLLACCLTLTAFPALAQTYTVVGVADGDTLTVLGERKDRIKCRLHSIDAPERSQAYGQASKQSLSDLTYRRAVQIQIVDADHYGRSVCRIWVDGLDVNREQIVRGMAWTYRKYAKDPGYYQAEEKARMRRVGLWTDPTPTPPWDFRRSKRSSRKD